MAGVVHEDVEAAEAFLSQVDGGFPIVFARYIKAYIARFTAQLPDLPLDRFALVIQDIAEDDICAFQREEERLVRALSPRRTGYNRRLAIQSVHYFTSLAE